MTKTAATQNDTATVGAQFIAPEASPEHGQKCGVSGWRECKLADAPLEIVDGDRGKSYPSQNEFFDVGHCLFLSTKNVRFNGFDFSDCQFITKEKDGLLRKGKLRRNDVILTTRGTVGNLGFYGDSIAYENVRINSGMVIIRPNTDSLYPVFNFYLFRHLQSDFQTHTSGSAQPQLPIRDLKEMYVSIPPLPEQKAIAAVLSSLDDKIDLLHRQNQTLEAMAQTLFRQWFIEEAREDWETKKINDLVEIQSGFAFKSSSFTDDGTYKLITIKAVQDGYLDIKNADAIDVIANKVPSYCVLEENDILLSLTGNVGRCCLVDRNNLLLNQRVAKLKPINSSNWAFTYILFRQAAMKQNLEDLSKGSAQANLSPIETGLIEIAIPKENVFIKFSDVVTPSMSKVMANKKQIQTLTQLRDTLLPKLMSGEIRVEVEYE